MKEFYLEVDVTQRKRIRVLFQSVSRPTEDEMQKILDAEDYEDILEVKTLETLSVDYIHPDF